MEWVWSAVITALIVFLVKIGGHLNETPKNEPVEKPCAVHQDGKTSASAECDPDGPARRDDSLSAVFPPSEGDQDLQREDIVFSRRTGPAVEAPVRTVYWLQSGSLPSVGDPVRPRGGAP